MGVFTPVGRDDAQAIARAYGLGEVGALRGIAAGSVNSNFALECASGRFFLRIYEEQDAAGAAAEARLLAALEARGVKTPAPLRLPGAAAAGGGLLSLSGKPVAIFPWREGTMRCQASVTPADAMRVGAELARVHVAGEGVPVGEGRFRLEDLRARLESIGAAADPSLASQRPALEANLAIWSARRAVNLPAGLVHGDLFRDNVLWGEDGEVAALLDFESASRGCYAFDLMVTVLAWSFGDRFDAAIARALCDGYRSVRELGELERRALLAEGCIAALRFAITRITDYTMRAGGVGPRVMKDWRRFSMRLHALESLGEGGLRAALGVAGGP